ncbi:MAG: carboxypeptidase regulatory-like domain-containing protein [Bryobacterales bacterium]|nr:carboxypeptidase regulatory-like domain-containing protein [Bryobacterales bacterium]
MTNHKEFYKIQFCKGYFCLKCGRNCACTDRCHQRGDCGDSRRCKRRGDYRRDSRCGQCRNRYRQSAATTPEGLYRLRILPIGEYSVSVSAKGFAGYERSGVNLNAGTVATVNVELQLHKRHNPSTRVIRCTRCRSGKHGCAPAESMATISTPADNELNSCQFLQPLVSDRPPRSGAAAVAHE